jgi:hypothetical protein
VGEDARVSLEEEDESSPEVWAEEESLDWIFHFWITARASISLLESSSRSEKKAA